MKIGDYVRTKDGIYKITNNKPYKDCYNDWRYGVSGRYTTIPKRNIIKSSSNIIDLIEVGDYINGYKVSFKDNDIEPFIQCDYPAECGITIHYRFTEKAIYSIVTKEQFESMEYEVYE